MCEWQTGPVGPDVTFSNKELIIFIWTDQDTWLISHYLLNDSVLLCVCVQGNVLVFYKELPLSIQDGYEKFLSSDTLTLQQYQVRLI